MRRQTYVTPKSYLSFIITYKSTYSSKRGEIDALAERMVSGLEKLSEATEAVNRLSEGLVGMEKELAAANKKAEEVLTRVKQQASAAQAVKEQVQIVKDKAETLVEAIGKDKGIAEERLEAARPALEEAEEALKTIKTAHIATGNRKIFLLLISLNHYFSPFQYVNWEGHLISLCGSWIAF